MLIVPTYFSHAAATIAPIFGQGALKGVGISGTTIMGVGTQSNFSTSIVDAAADASRKRRKERRSIFTDISRFYFNVFARWALDKVNHSLGEHNETSFYQLTFLTVGA
jgi:hypothetical protein